MTRPHAPPAAPRLPVLSRLLDRLRPLPRVNHVAFGTFCHVASSLRSAGLRRWTGPFDWIFSAPGLLAECLDDGFAGFLAPAALRSVPAAERLHGAKRQCHHVAYEARYGLPTLFNHHDPAGSRADRQALGRAARRMRQALAGRHVNHLYMMSEVVWPADEIAALAGRLGAGPARNTLVVITARGGEAERAWRSEPLPGAGCPVVAIELRTRSHSNGVLFPDPEDEAFFQERLRALAATLGDAGSGRGVGRMSLLLAWVVAHPIVSHCVVGLVMMAIVSGLLQPFRVRGWAWHAAAAVSLFFYAREAAQAERALKPVLGDPVAFFVTLWPGGWTAGGARLGEWLAPTILCLALAALLPRRPFGERRRELRLGREKDRA